LTCQVPRTNDFFIGVLHPLTNSRLHGEPIRFRSSPRKRGPSRSWIPAFAGTSVISLGQTETIRGRRHFAWPSRIARQSRSGVAGISMWRTPRGGSAATTALATAGRAPRQAASPAPVTPSGLVLVGTGLLLTSTALMLVARGMA